MDLNEALDTVQVDECDEMIVACKEAGLVQSHPPGWWGVSTEEGVIAYFNDERKAFQYRLFLINEMLNGKPPS